jgi:hypothetical protein
MKTTIRSALMLLVPLLAACGQQLVEFPSAGGNAVVPGSAPVVTSTIPASSATNVAVGTVVSATFSQAMDATTLTATTFTLRQGTTAITGAVSYAGMTATLTPTSSLAASTVYSATITTGAKSSAGVPMAALYTWSFTTAGPGVVAPTVVSTDPADLATLVALNKQVSATFNVAMDGTTLTTTTFTLKNGLVAVPGAVSSAGATATFAPTAPLAPSTTYTASISTAAKDTLGTAMALPHTWSFTTAALVPGPVVTVTNPLNLATNVLVGVHPTATFSKPMDATTITASTYTLKQGAASVSGNVTFDVLTDTATFTPSAALQTNTLYTATVTTGVKDTTAIAMAADYVWTFTTEAAVIPPPLAINLGAAASFGIASRAGLTSTGVTVVNGDVALSPTPTCSDATGNAGASQTCLVKTYASTTGMTVNGSIYWAGDPFDSGVTAATVTTDLNAAWVEGMAKVDTKGPVAGDQMALQTFNPGVYHNANLGLAAGGTTTLDALGDANGVFIFKVDSDFVDSGTLLLPTTVVLVGGAQARNVWFVTGRDITIGSGTHWNGNILAGRTATVKDGSTVLGRVLAGAAGAGAITLTGAASPSVTSITVP